MAQIIVQNPWALAAFLLAWLLVLLFAWPRRFRPFGPFLLRLAMVALVGLALARPVYLPPNAAAGPEPEPVVVLLVDQSASLGEAGQAALRREASRLARGPAKTITLFFAARPVLGDMPAEGLPDIERTNLADALEMAGQMLAGHTGRVILLSDGLPTEGDTGAAVSALARNNIPVDVLQVGETLRRSWANSPNEIRLTGLDVPPVLRQDTTFSLVVTIHAARPANVTLRVVDSAAASLLAEDEVSLEAGFNSFTFDTQAGKPGPRRFTATLSAADDGQPANNSLSAFTQVYPRPRVLVVAQELLPGTRFAGLLGRAGFIPEQARPSDLPDRLSALEAYDGIVLLDVSARSLKLEQMIALQEFVRSLGRGMLVAGGRNSFSLGAYQDTPLADLLPVLLEPPPREERPPVALLLVVDHSGSMVEEREPATKLAMAKEAAIRATDILGPEDLIGVLMFDNRYEWVVPFQPVRSGAALLEIQQAIATIPGGGGTRILQALEVGLPALAEQQTASAARHAVLLTDGKSFDGPRGLPDYDQVVEAALEAGITLSTIAIGADADVALLTHLAERGRGRYHFASRPEELPELTIAESDILRSSAVQEGEFRPAVFAPHPMLRGLFGATVLTSETGRMPDLSGYIAVTPKPRAEVALQIGPGDPLLSVWGYGLGRVAAWTSDAGADWGSSLFSWPDVARFWGQVVGYTLPEPGLGLLQLSTEVAPGGVVTLVADSVTAAGQTVDLAPPQVELVTPANRDVRLTLRQVAPGQYRQQLRLPHPGAYQMTVSQARDNASAETATGGFVVPYPAEYGLPDEDAGEPLLRRIANATGGHIFAPGESPPAVQAAANTAALPPPPQELWPWLLQVALVLWPVEIAWRRRARLRIQ